MKSNIYISRKVLNYQDIVKWARESGFETMMPEDSLHITVVFCKHAVDWNLVKRDQPEMLLVPEEDKDEETLRGVHEFNGGACVLEIDAPDLKKRNHALGKLGIKSGFPDYRAHITITYNKPEDMNVDKIIPYRGPIILGPEVIEPASNGWKEDFKEISLDDIQILDEDVNLDMDQLYDIFSSSYDKATGQSWTKEKFMNRASNWTFYGNDNGFVAFRKQASGMRKLVGVAGETSGVIEGLKQLSNEDYPTWGAVSDKLARASKRFGFIAPHLYPGGKLVIKIVMGLIPKSVFGGLEPKIQNNGGVVLSYDDLGDQEKFFIANKKYFANLLNDPNFIERVTSKAVIAFVKRLAR